VATTQQADNLNALRKSSEKFLNQHTIGIDHGVKKPKNLEIRFFGFMAQKRTMERNEKKIRRGQRRFARQEVIAKEERKKDTLMAKALKKTPSREGFK
jgi:hypothetical protein